MQCIADVGNWVRLILHFKYNFLFYLYNDFNSSSCFNTWRPSLQQSQETNYTSRSNNFLLSEHWTLLEDEECNVFSESITVRFRIPNNKVNCLVMAPRRPTFIPGWMLWYSDKSKKNICCFVRVTHTINSFIN